MRELLAPTEPVAVIWAIFSMVALWGWTWYCTRRMVALLGRIRTDDSTLWSEIGAPESWRQLIRSGRFATLRRLRRDDLFARRFNSNIVSQIRDYQRETNRGLAIVGALGCFVLYLVWPYLD